MPFYLLDTDTCIFLLNQRGTLAESRLRTLGRDEAGLSAITMAELYYGAAHSRNREANERRVEVFCSSIRLCPFDEEAARLFGRVKELLISTGKMVGIMDLLIASCALALKAVLVTHNLQDFHRIPGLQVEDWF